MRLAVREQSVHRSPTSEELVANVVKQCEPLSYRGLPILLYPNQMWFRVELGAHGMQESQEVSPT